MLFRSGFTAQVRRVILAELADGAEEEAVARALHVSRRTLQRRLADDGTSFRLVLEDLRKELAERYLKDPGNSIVEVAFLLGFSDQSSFHRAFQRWTGASPGRWRREQDAARS